MRMDKLTNQLQLALADAQSLALGGNVRVGLEDSLWIGPGQLAQSNAQQVRAVRHVQKELGSYFNNNRVLFLSGMRNYEIAVALSDYTKNLSFADPVFQAGSPVLLGFNKHPANGESPFGVYWQSSWCAFLLWNGVALMETSI